MQHTGNLINAVGVLQADHRTLFNVGKQSDFAAAGLVDFMIATTNQHVGLQSNRRSSLTEC